MAVMLTSCYAIDYDVLTTVGTPPEVNAMLAAVGSANLEIIGTIPVVEMLPAGTLTRMLGVGAAPVVVRLPAGTSIRMLTMGTRPVIVILPTGLPHPALK